MKSLATLATQLHHGQTEIRLRRVQRTNLSADQLARRAELLDAYRDYWRGGVFPVNNLRRRPICIFRGEEGQLCAVANMIHHSGHDEIIDEVVATNNYIEVKDLKDGPVVDWIEHSGFTQAELADVQVPYVASKMADTAPATHAALMTQQLFIVAVAALSFAVVVAFAWLARRRYLAKRAKTD